MPTNNELQSNQRELLFKLLRLEKRNPDVAIVGLKDEILEIKAVMSQEDIAHVEKIVNSL